MTWSISPQAPRRLPGLPRALLLALLALTAVVGLALPAAASGSGEVVQSYDAQVTLRPDGSMRVLETIVYAFSGDEHHGIYRDLTTELDAGDRVRRYPVTDVDVSSPSGAPDDAQTIDEGSRTRIRIGDADTTVTGVQTYVIGYTVSGVLDAITTATTSGATTVPPHDELFWNIAGDRWEVPIRQSRVRVLAATATTAVDCFRGARGSTDRCEATAGSTSVFSSGALRPGQGMSVLLAYPTGSVGAVAPLLTDRPRGAADRWREISPLGVAASAALTALVAGALVRRSRQPGSAPPQATTSAGPSPYVPGYDAAAPSAVPVVAALRATPPDGVRPGQLGVLLTGRTATPDVSATVIDLAVRGFLTLEELGDDPKNPDWRLRAVYPAPTQDLLPYELNLLQAIFRGRDEVRLRELRLHFAGDLRHTRALLGQDVVTHGWFAANPASVSARYRWLGGAAMVLSFPMLLIGAGAFPLLAVVGAGVAVCGLLAVVLAGRMPQRTPAGTAARQDAEAFASYLRTAAPERVLDDAGARIDAFSRYLPYAMVLGLTNRWSRMFDDLARQGRSLSLPGWYAGQSDAWTYGGIGTSMGTFQSTSISVMGATTSSSGGSGFSGGSSGDGGGGGGGGSW